MVDRPVLASGSPAAKLRDVLIRVHERATTAHVAVSDRELLERIGALCEAAIEDDEVTATFLGRRVGWGMETLEDEPASEHRSYGECEWCGRPWIYLSKVYDDTGVIEWNGAHDCEGVLVVARWFGVDRLITADTESGVIEICRPDVEDQDARREAGWAEPPVEMSQTTRGMARYDFASPSEVARRARAAWDATPPHRRARWSGVMGEPPPVEGERVMGPEEATMLTLEDLREAPPGSRVEFDEAAVVRDEFGIWRSDTEVRAALLPETVILMTVAWGYRFVRGSA